MFTILDYIKYYKTSSLKKINFNMMDQLVCALLSYLPISSFNGERVLDEVLESAIKDINPKNIKGFHKDIYNFAKSLLSSKRYHDMKLANFVNIRNDKTQFGAVTIVLEDKKIISFKGTDESIIGWLENFRTAYSYPTYTQELALKYFYENINEDDKTIYLVGHSKGGNLATYVGMEIDDDTFARVKKIYSFDGPGFRLEQFESEKFERVSKKLVNIIPTGSYVGTIMYNKKPEVVKTNTIAINEHYPTNWTLFGEFFNRGELSKISKEIHENTTTKLMELEPELVEKTIEFVFNSLNKNYTDNIKVGFKEMITIYNKIKKLDPKVNAYFDHLFNSIIKSIYK